MLRDEIARTILEAWMSVPWDRDMAAADAVLALLRERGEERCLTCGRPNVADGFHVLHSPIRCQYRPGWLLDLGEP